MDYSGQNVCFSDDLYQVNLIVVAIWVIADPTP